MIIKYCVLVLRTVKICKMHIVGPNVNSYMDIFTWKNRVISYTSTFYLNKRFWNWKAQKSKNDNLKIINIKIYFIDKIQTIGQWFILI